jgi:Ala-tRNA(Pro) deacylase
MSLPSGRTLSRAEVAVRVPQFLTDQQVCFETVVHPPSFTAQKLARNLHISGRHVVKSVLLAGNNTYYLAVLPAAMRVDLSAVSEHLGITVRLASEDDLARLFNDCERGAVTPFGHLYGLTTLLEASITPESTVVFESGRHVEAIRMTCRDFERLERPRRFPFARAAEVRHPRAS